MASGLASKAWRQRLVASASNTGRHPGWPAESPTWETAFRNDCEAWRQRAASALNFSCHPGWRAESPTYAEFDAPRKDHEAVSQGCHPTWLVAAELDALGNNYDAGSHTPSRRCSSNPSDREEPAPTTTLEIHDVPCSYTAKRLQEELDLAGFRGQYDFLDLPPVGPNIRHKRALVNFASSSVAEAFWAKFHRGLLPGAGPQDSPVSVAAAPFQGFNECAGRHPAGVLYRASGMRFVGSKPTVTMPPPGLERVEPQPPIGRPQEERPQPRGGRRLAATCGSGPPGTWCTRSDQAAVVRRQLLLESSVPTWGKEQWNETRAMRARASTTGSPMSPFQGSEPTKAPLEVADGEVLYFSL